MTPIYSAYRGTGIPYEVKNSIGLTIRDYDDAIINICKQMGVKCIDIYPNCGINRHNYSQLMFDYTHPNKNGLSKIADVVFNELK
jgi:lysophospholipase L1-like esterase